MSFLIRQVSRTADGREIIRANPSAQTALRIGRDAACDIHLPDLAVDLDHATVTRRADGRLHIASNRGLKFDLDGRSVELAEVDPAVGAELGFGGHRLTVSRDGDTAVITVVRASALSDSTEAKDEAALFSLTSVVFGRRPTAWAFLVAILAVFLVWPIYTFSTTYMMKQRGQAFHADTMWSSGPLSIAHQKLSNNCQSCHNQQFVSATNTTCLTCHKDTAHNHAAPNRIAQSMPPKGSFDQAIGVVRASFNIPEGRCVECHTEHEGAGWMKPTSQAFCADCHAGMNTRLKDTRIGNVANFGTLHPQFKPAVVIDPTTPKPLLQRVSLDMRPQSATGLKFPHAIHLSKTNGIARMAQTLSGEYGFGDALACKDCHQQTADRVSFKKVEMEQSCEMCHSLTYDNIGGRPKGLHHGEPARVINQLTDFYRTTLPAPPANLGTMVRRRPGSYAELQTAQDYALGVRLWPKRAAGAVRATFAPNGACYDCHVITPAAGGYNIREVVQPERYLMKGWFNHAAHGKETCQSCHAAERSNLASDLLLPDLASCRTCHVGEGGGALIKVKKPVESSCAMCHEYHIDGKAPWRSHDQKLKAKQRLKAPEIASLK